LPLKPPQCVGLFATILRQHLQHFRYAKAALRASGHLAGATLLALWASRVGTSLACGKILAALGRF